MAALGTRMKMRCPCGREVEFDLVDDGGAAGRSEYRGGCPNCGPLVVSLTPCPPPVEPS